MGRRPNSSLQDLRGIISNARSSKFNLPNERAFRFTLGLQRFTTVCNSLQFLVIARRSSVQCHVHRARLALANARDQRIMGGMNTAAPALRPVDRVLLDLITAYPDGLGLSHFEIAKRIGQVPATVGIHLREMERVGLIDVTRSERRGAKPNVYKIVELPADTT
jgi:hypothetical protein